jgi:class 3 adenylate cyclase
LRVQPVSATPLVVYRLALRSQGLSRTLIEPQKLSAVLFTDIVGSTEKAAALGDRRWRDLLDEHD